MRKGLTEILTLFIGGLITLSIAAGGFVIDSLSNRVTAVENRANNFEADMSSVKTDISWIKGALVARGFAPTDPVTTTEK